MKPKKNIKTVLLLIIVAAYVYYFTGNLKSIHICIYVLAGFAVIYEMFFAKIKIMGRWNLFIYSLIALKGPIALLANLGDMDNVIPTSWIISIILAALIIFSYEYDPKYASK